MKTLKKLSNRKLDKLQDRLAEKWWRETDVAPYEPRRHLIRRADKMLCKIAKERLRRIGL